MANTTQDELYRRFMEVAGQQAYESADTRALLTDVIAQFQEVRDRLPGAAPSAQTPASKPTTTETAGSTAGTVGSTILKSGFGLAPLVAGLFNLFRGDEPEAAPALVKYAMPGSIQFQAAERNSRLTALDYDQMGLARDNSIENPAPQVIQRGPQVRPEQLPEQSQQSPQVGSGQQITVNVQAMDARSFLDRSNEIAMAVRDAMLNLSPINDVVNEL